MSHHYFVSYMGILLDNSIRYCDASLEIKTKINCNDMKKLHQLLIEKSNKSFSKVCILSINYLGEFEDEQ